MTVNRVRFSQTLLFIFSEGLEALFHGLTATKARLIKIENPLGPSPTAALPFSRILASLRFPIFPIADFDAGFCAL